MNEKSIVTNITASVFQAKVRGGAEALKLLEDAWKDLIQAKQRLLSMVEGDDPEFKSVQIVALELEQMAFQVRGFRRDMAAVL